MAKWVILGDNDNIEKFLDSLPKNFKNVSNFNSYDKPWEYGVYKYVEILPTYDPKYEFLNQQSKVKTEETLTITYVVEKVPVESARQQALAEINNIKQKLYTKGVLFEEYTYKATYEETNLILSRLLAIQSGYKIPDSFCWTDITGRNIPFNETMLTQLNVEILKYRDIIDAKYSLVINSLYYAGTTTDVQAIVNSVYNIDKE